MTNLYEEGGIADDGMARDPVSGNEIPPGSMAVEVRDDVDAKLSQGEYVVPADVVRFFGVAFFEGLRSKAKEGLAQMEAGGRIGGEPVPNEEEMGMAKGGDVGIDKDARKILESLKRSPQLRARLKDSGVVIKMAEGGDVGTQTQSAFSVPYQGLVGFSTLGSTMNVVPQQNIEYKTYKNASGDTRVIMFVNGQPQQAIPDGFYPEGEVPEAPKAEEPKKQDKDPDLTAPSAPAAPRTPAVNLYGMSEDELSAWAQGGLGGSVLGGAGGLIGTAADLDAISRTRAAARIAEDKGYEALTLQLQTAASDMQEDLGWIGDILQGTIATGEQYYEDQQQFRNAAPTASGVIGTGTTPLPSSKTNQQSGSMSNTSTSSSKAPPPASTKTGPTGTTAVIGSGTSAPPTTKTNQQSGSMGTTTSTTTKTPPPPTTKMAMGGLIKRPNR